jgi:hypothetical protein
VRDVFGRHFIFLAEMVQQVHGEGADGKNRIRRLDEPQAVLDFLAVE